MDSAQVKKTLKDGYEDAGFEVVAEMPDGSTHLRYAHAQTNDILLRLAPDDVRDYAELLAAADDFRTAPAPTSLVSRRYREQLLHLLDATLPERLLAGTTLTVGETRLSIERASPVFVNYFRFDAGYMALCLDRLFTMSTAERQRTTQQPLDLRAMFFRPLTIRAHTDDAASIDAAVQQSDAAFDAALFLLAANNDVPLLLADEWYAPRHAHLPLPDAATDVPTLTHPFRRELVRLYQSGLAAALPEQQFLAFYGVLAFHFQTLGDATAYEQVAGLLRAPDFAPDALHIARLVDAAQGSRRSAPALLTTLIQQQMQQPAFAQFVEQHDGTRSTAVALAERIQRLHAAIIGAGNDASVPPSVDSPAVRRDVPLVRFLATQVLLTTTT